MKKVLPILMMTAFLVTGAHAQKGKNGLNISAEAGIPLGNFGDVFKTGLGGSVKGLYGTGTAGQVTFTTGVTLFKRKADDPDYDANVSIIPIFAGYRHSFGGLFLEPQAGLGIYHNTYFYSSRTSSYTNTGVTYAIGAGFTSGKFEIGARYQNGIRNMEGLKFIGLRIGYTIAFGN